MWNQGPWINFMRANQVCKGHRQLFLNKTHCIVSYIVMSYASYLWGSFYWPNLNPNFFLQNRYKRVNSRCCKIGNGYMAMLTTCKCWKAFLAFLKEELENPLKITFCLPTYLVHFLTAREFLQILTIYHQ